MTPPQKIRPLSSARALLTRSRVTPRESVVGSGTVALALCAVAGFVLTRRLLATLWR